MQISQFKTQADFINAAPPPEGCYLRFVKRNEDGSATEFIKDHTGTVRVLNAGGGGGGDGIPEAPVDGKPYARQDAAWTEVVTGEGNLPPAALSDVGKILSLKRVGGDIDDHTLVLLHLDGDLDNKGVIPGLDITLHGNAALVEGEGYFGGDALYLDGSSSDYLSIAANALLSLTGELCVDFWMKPIQGVNHTGFFYMGASWSAGALAVHTNAGDYCLQPGSNSGGDVAVPVNVWSHVRYSRDAEGTFHLFANGTQIASHTTAGSWANVPFYIGGPNAGFSNPFKGYFSEFRISNVSRGAENFTPPDHPYSGVASAAPFWKDSLEIVPGNATADAVVDPETGIVTVMACETDIENNARVGEAEEYLVGWPAPPDEE
jgi:hypothetical protein